MTLPATSQAQIIEAHLRVSESIREFRHQLRTRRASGMFGCNAAHAFFLTYLLSFFSFLLLLNLMGSVTPFSIKISGSEGTPDMMAFKAKAPKPSIPAAGTRERYVTLPHLTSNFGDFAIRRSKPRRSPTSDFAITTVRGMIPTASSTALKCAPSKPQHATKRPRATFPGGLHLVCALAWLK